MPDTDPRNRSQRWETGFVDTEYVYRRPATNEVYKRSDWSGPTRIESESMLDFEVPGWRQRIKQKRPVTNPVTHEKWETEYGVPSHSNYLAPALRDDGTVREDTGHDIRGPRCASRSFTLPMLGSEILPEVDVVGMKADTAIRLRENSDITEAEALVSLAEFPKTLETVYSVLNPLMLQVRKGRRLKRRMARIKSGNIFDFDPQEIADAWLALRYEIRPLWFDVSDSLAALDKSLTKSAPRKSSRAFTERTDSRTVNLPNSTPGGSILYDVQVTSVVHTAVSSGGIFDITESGVGKTLAIWGLDKPFTAAWEILPWSFMVDWILNVGGWLAALEPSAAVTGFTSWTTIKSTLTQSGSIINARRPAGYYPGRANSLEFTGDAHCVYSHFERELGAPIPSFPPFKLRLNTAKMVDLIALISGVHHGSQERRSSDRRKFNRDLQRWKRWPRNRGRR